MDRLIDAIGLARGARDRLELDRLSAEIDALAADAVRYAREREPDPRTMSAVSIAIETARATLQDARRRTGSP
ncbi:hypothetical protein U8607_09665 [Methylobacterium durans]|uniref:hypothetical protein n=1 Tax=Methylobacterium durans TaxID=2202825 RepID=UPI002B000D87|nr:hypothetical protein [Methylobacterium durans]MEA1832351.1 hypothetical protein [Methylobacterium durans]